MDRPRRKRRDPQRTGPIRNAGAAWREGEPRRSAMGPWDDASSSGVREGYRVIEEQIRRGRRMAQELGDETRSDDRYGRERRRRSRDFGEPRSGYGEESWPRYEGGLLGMPLWHLDRLVREIQRQIVSVRPDPWRLIELIFRLQIEAISELARLGFGALGMVSPRRGDAFDEDYRRVDRDIDESWDRIEDLEDDEIEDLEDDEIEDLEDDELVDELWEWPAAPSVPTVIRSTVPIPIYVSAHEKTEIDLELPPGAQSLELVVEPPVVIGPDPPALPAFEAELVTLPDGPVILRIEVPRDLPAGRYRRRLLDRATDEAVGELTVQVGTLQKEEQP